MPFIPLTGNNATINTTKPTKQASQLAQESSGYKPTFPSSKTDSPLTSGLKAAGNLPASALNLGKSVAGILFNPIQTGKGIIKTAAGGVEKLIPGKQASEDYFDQFTGALKQRYGSLEALQKTATEDPFAFGADVASIFAGGAALAGKSAELANFASKTAQLVTKPVSKVASTVAKTGGSVGKFGVSQATGLNPETIKTISNAPAEFSRANMSSVSREGIGGEVYEAIGKRMDDLSETGTGYDSIRELPGTVKVAPDAVKSVLDKYKISVGQDGKVISSPESLPLSAADRSALEDFLGVYGGQTELSNNAFLNTRAALSQLSKYDAAKTGNLQKVARDLRGAYDEAGKSQIEGLVQLDSKYSSEKTILDQIRKDYLTKEGTFKDGAVNKIANLTGKGKEQVLDRLEEIMPGVGERVKVLKAVEDIQAATGQKVGTYARGALAVFGAGTGNIPALVTAIIASPSVAVPLIRAYGLKGAQVGELMMRLKAYADKGKLPVLAAPVIDKTVAR